ncbi:aa3-type cytochrome c oxidase subunit IV [Kaistia adipata]
MTDSPMDYREHEKTYAFFTGLTKWGTIACVVVLILMAIFLL